MTSTTSTTTTPTANYQYDYLVIGGGSGGVSSARRAAGYGSNKVAIVEANRFGGTCVNVGCVPKKIMFQAASLREMIQQSKHYTFPESEATFNWRKLKEKRDAYILRLNNIYTNNLQKSGVHIYQGWGTCKDPHTVIVTQKDGSVLELTARYILIAVGGKPMVVPETEGIEHTITSDGFFELEALPSKVVCVGAGYIAVELAGVLHTLGSETHLVLRKHVALRNFDADIANFLDHEMTQSGIHIHRNTNGVSKVELRPDGTKTVTCHDGTVLDGCDVVLMAPGRVPNVHGLNLEEVGVQLNHQNEIIVDEYQNTSVESIFALGDVCNQGMELTPMAIAAGRRLADRLFNGEANAKTSYENVPTVVFSHPPIGTCGMTEKEAEEAFGKDNLKIYKSTFVNLYFSMFEMEPSEKPKTFYKLICAGKEEKVVGLHLIGMASDEVLQGFGVAMKMGATKADFDACVAIHPTAAEELVTMGTWGTSPPFSGAKHSPLMGAPASKPTID